MEISQVIHDRRAVREYSGQPVDEATLRALIEAAEQAPSAGNEQPWLFSVIRDRAVLARIGSAARAHLREHPPAGISLGHLHPLHDDPAADVFHHAPVLIVISSQTQGPWAATNCALAAENLMLAARAAGLGTCWIGMAQGWLGTAEGKAAIQVPPAALPVAPIIVGYPKAFPAPVPREAPRIRWIG